MKVYFAGSIRGGRDDAEIYKEIIALIQNLGHEVLTEHIGLESLKDMGEQDKTEEWIYERDMAWVNEADAIVAEVTNPSLGVGYELGQAEAMSKEILCLFRPSSGKSLSAMIAGNKAMRVKHYSAVSDLNTILADFLQ